VIPGLEDVEALRALADPVRRRVYGFVAASAGPVTRDEAAAALGLGRSLAAYHLDRLGASGLLSVTYGRPSGRRGPGAGRPAKLYTRAEREFTLHAPPREYALVAEILLRAGAGRTPADAAREVGRELGRAAPRGPIAEVLRARGYEPFDDDGTLRFANCPFDALAQKHRQTVCSLNLELVEGVLEGAGAGGVSATLEPDRAGCCVAVR
jgi:predicted ArsR family transcriptional regulator